MLTAKQSEELAAWCNRLGSPPAAVLNNLHKLVEGAPDVLRKANVANVANDARMLATARKIPAPSLKYPLATKAGERTARDWWDAKTTSRIDGSKGCRGRLLRCVVVQSCVRATTAACRLQQSNLVGVGLRCRTSYCANVRTLMCPPVPGLR